MGNALILIADGFEEIEAITIYDILVRGSVKVDLCSIKSECNVKSSHGLSICCNKSIGEINLEDYEVLILPGGMPGALNLKENYNVIHSIKEFFKEGKLICAICAAPMVLKEAGIIEDVCITSYPSFRNEFLKELYKIDRVIECGNIITSRGPATASDFAFKILEHFISLDKVNEIKKAMLY